MLTTEEIAALMRANDTFSEVPGEALDELAAGATERSCAAGEDIIRQGVRCGDLFLVVEGGFAVSVADGTGGGEREVAQLGRGRVFGEIGVVSGIQATASVRATTDGRLISIPGKHFHLVMHHTPRLAESVLRSMARY